MFSPASRHTLGLANKQHAQAAQAALVYWLTRTRTGRTSGTGHDTQHLQMDCTSLEIGTPKKARAVLVSSMFVQTHDARYAL